MYKLIIAGSRDITDYDVVRQFIDSYIRFYGTPSRIITGGARGVDRLGLEYARQMDISATVVHPDWSIGREAGKLRNIEMAKLGDKLLAIWDGMSPGTAHMIAYMCSLNKPVYVETKTKQTA